MFINSYLILLGNPVVQIRLSLHSSFREIDKNYNPYHLKVLLFNYLRNGYF